MTVHHAPDRVVAYGLTRPGWTEARASLQRVFGPDADTTWAELLTTIGADHLDPTDATAFPRLIDAFLTHEHPVVRLCGQALKIRAESFRHLAGAHNLIENPT